MLNTVSLAMICKNEQSNIGQLLDIVCPILEEVIIVDTGSTDDTLSILKDYQSKYNNLIVDHFEWVKDFSKARNYAFSKATQTWVMFLDCDDLVDPIELKKFKEDFLGNENVDCWILDYIYSRYPNGEPQTILGRERFLRRSCNPTWIGAIHETVAIWDMRQMNYSSLKVIHNQTGKTIDYNRNVDILESEYEKNPNDPRTAYYYGKELFDRVDSKGIEVLNHFVSMKNTYWDDEINARFRLACDHLVKNELDQALDHADRIYRLDGTRLRAEGYWIYGQVEQKLRNQKVAIRWYNRCLDGEPPSPRVLNREYYTWNPMFRMSECYLELGNLEESIKWFEKVCTIIPYNNPMVQQLEEKIINTIPANPLRIIEDSPNRIRKDSTTITNILECKYFGNGKFDGLVLHENRYIDTNKVKPLGFVWSKDSMTYPYGNYLTTCEFNGTNIISYINHDESLPTFFIQEMNNDFGPYRIRLGALRKSLIKSGHRVDKHKPDYLISSNLHNLNSYFETEPRIRVLDVCEWLPESDYKNVGIDIADIVICSSHKLQELMHSKFPKKIIKCVEDHVDFSDREWL